MSYPWGSIESMTMSPSGHASLRDVLSGPGCAPTCAEHPEHVYVLCYGQPVYVRSRDYLRRETERNYPIDHYVGYTRQQPPVKRVRQHGCRSAQHIARIVPGDERLELGLKLVGRCPTCGGSLWYYQAPRLVPRRRA
jgi:hypothetical protein